MAWQEKTFTWGSFDPKSELNAYVLELALSENHVDKINNYSEVSYCLTLKSGRSNRFQCDVTSTLKFNGEQVGKKTENKYLDYESSWILLSGTVKKIPHNADGTLNMQIEVSIDTTNSNEWAPPDKTFRVEWPLTKIARASTISGAARVDLGSACSITWTPNSAAFGYKLRFFMKNASGSVVWEKTTDPIHPNKTSAYTYSGYTIPLDGVAQQITDSKTGTMKVVLTTYADSSCKTVVGSDDASFTVTVPENEDTMPTVTMELTPVQPAVMPKASPLYGFYLQGISRVNATLRATPKLETTIRSYSLIVGEVSTTAATGALLTNPVVDTEEIKVVGTATDERTIAGSVEDTITVLPYSKPRLSATAYRCLSDGSQSDTGTQLKINPVATFAPVLVDDLPQNSGSISWRYRAEGEAFPDNYTEWVDEALLDVGSLAVDKAYEVEIRAGDDAGQTVSVFVSIPTESIYKHKPPGGKGFGLGGYCEGPGLTVHWDVNLKKNLSVDGELKVGDKLRVGGEGTAYIGGVYIGNVAVSGTDQLRIQTQIMITSASRQSIFLFGFDNYMLVQGVVGALDTGVATWNGTEGISVEMDEDGVVTITMPHIAYDRLVAISGDAFNFV